VRLIVTWKHMEMHAYSVTARRPLPPSPLLTPLTPTPPHAPHPVPGKGFSVAFDPLDGSSIVDTNFSVGTIFGVWPGDDLTGITGRQQVEMGGGGWGVWGGRGGTDTRSWEVRGKLGKKSPMSEMAGVEVPAALALQHFLWLTQPFTPAPPPPPHP
jgi:hypothetical protein